MKNVIKKMADDVIVSEMIDYLTNNEIIKGAAKKALELCESDYSPELLNKKFTARVFNNMPKPQVEDDFYFSDSDESAAMDEFVRIQNIIDRATSGELDVRSVGQVYK